MKSADVLKQEMSVATAPSIEGPTHLQVEVTSRCNFTCGFCIGRHLPQGDLSLEQFGRLLDQLPTVKYVQLTGEGEPLMHRDFFAMAQMAHDRGLDLALITNGSMLTQEACDRLLNLNFSCIGVSIESLDADEFRRIRGGSLPQVLRNVARLAETRRRTGLSTPMLAFMVTVLARTADYIPAILELSNRLGLDPPMFQALQRKREYVAIYENWLDGEHPDSDTENLLGALDFVRGQWQQNAGIQDYYSTLWGLPSMRDACKAAARAMYVGHDGYATPCCIIKDPAVLDVNTSERPAREGWEATQRVVNDALRGGVVPDACRGCEVADAVVSFVDRR